MERRWYKDMKKKTANLYVKMTAKTPVLFLSLIVLSVWMIVYITMTTEVDVIKTYEAKVENNKLVIFEADAFFPDRIYFYENRDEAVYELRVKQEEITYDGTTMVVSLGEMMFEPETGAVKADIPVEKISLFRRVFLQGGKNE